MAKKPQIDFLADLLKPSDTALQAVPYLRSAAYAGPIVVISGQVTKKRRIALEAAGANDVIHKDELDTKFVSRKRCCHRHPGTCEGAEAQARRRVSLDTAKVPSAHELPLTQFIFRTVAQHCFMLCWGELSRCTNFAFIAGLARAAVQL
jgi:CheY-like chemotaxis protein